MYRDMLLDADLETRDWPDLLPEEHNAWQNLAMVFNESA